MPSNNLKYLSYSYTLNTTIAEAYEQVMDIATLQSKADIFEHGELQTNDLLPTAVGKSYVISMVAGDSTIETTITVKKVIKPQHAELTYEYQTIDGSGKRSHGAPMPWKSMKCIMEFQQNNEQTIVNTTMFTIGVNSLGQRIAARVLSLINHFQQKRIIRRVKDAIE